jgi:hypothetical protein
MSEKKPKGIHEICLPNGCTLFREENGAGGHRYTSDEIGGGVIVWDTCLVEESTLLAAIVDQAYLRFAEANKRTKTPKATKTGLYRVGDEIYNGNGILMGRIRKP